MSPQHKKKPKSANANSKLRIIGGQWRGRCLPFTEIDGLRPSGSRIRETLFNWLMPTLPGSRCLDLYAGSGALGFEAVSRGAAQCQMFELNRGAVEQLSTNTCTLKTTAVTVNQGNTLELLTKMPLEPFDIVFIDPPFSQGLWTQTANLLASHKWLAEGAYIYVETPSEAQPELPKNWKLHKQKIAGQVKYALYQKQ